MPATMPPSPPGPDVRRRLLLRGGVLADPERGVPAPGEVAVAGGRIAAVGAPGTLSAPGAEVYDARGLLVTPGLIDLHAHVYEGATELGLPADRAGIERGVTTVADAGSSGSDRWADFAASVVAPAGTRVLAWLNVARHGLVGGSGELAGGAADLDPEATAGVLVRERGRVRGLKVRMSRSALGGSGLAPLRIAREVAAACGVPVMVHVGNAPPELGTVLDLLGPGDVVTHAFHGKAGGLFGGGPEPLPQLRAALERGVRLDVGHGSASFAFGTAERALAAGIRPYTISTDLHRRNAAGPVHDLTTTMGKLLALGMPLPEVIRCVTLHPSEVLGMRGELGTLRVGAAADLTVLEERAAAAPRWLVDAVGERRPARRWLVPVAAVRAGRLVPVREAAA
ncbi:amidohydrolase/deacetylase family metallohydrolase [Streptomyces sp. GS7]|uniref:amidohydrolase/deacetylase family metallohydrolase n=1 Tax=Streptomyces sp. GS7 TaxID=2692234 RepID=UPI0013181A30|nr:amidohydrolase/deacetylase family metallohydrolase [Streptomyces sp. GS7]QHC22035.1 amidohydrolase/deacetylase family metallohydrolase [Streptomyces sp. GS7]